MPAEIEARAALELAPDCWIKPDVSSFITQELPDHHCIVDRILPAGHVTILGAHGGTGKSILAEIIGAHVAAKSKDWAGLAIDGGRVVYVSLEDPASIVMHRLRRITREYHGLSHAAIVANLTVLDGTETAGALATEVAEFGLRRLAETPAMKALHAHLAGAKLIIIDNASDAFDAGENDRRMVRGFVRMLAQLARQHQAAVLLLVHIDKNAAKYGPAGNSYSGSTAWHNSARSRLALIVTERDVVEMHQEKYNLGRRIAPIAFRWSNEGVLIPTHVASSARPVDTDATDDAGVLAALEAAAAADVSVPTGRTGPATAQITLQTFSQLPAQLHGGKGRVRFWAAIDRLHARGCVSSEEYVAANRHKRTRFVRVGGASNGARSIPPIPPGELAHASGAPLRSFGGNGTDAELTQTDAGDAP